MYWGVTFLVTSIFIRFVLGGDLRFAKEGVFLISAMVSAWWLGMEALPKKFLIPFLILGGLTFFNQFNSYNTAVYTQTCMVFAGMIVFASARTMKEEEWRHLENFLIICVLLHSTWIFLNYFGKDYWDFFNIPRITIDGHRNLLGNTLLIGAMHQPSMSGAALVGLLPFAYYLLPIPLIAIFLLKGSMCLLALGVASVWYIYQKYGARWVATYLAAGFLPGLYVLSKYPDLLKGGGRLGAWKAWELWPTDLFHRVFGFGVGWVYAIFGRQTVVNGEMFRQLHCEPLEIYATWGILGIGCFAWLFYQIKDFKSRYFYAFLMLWVNSLGNLTFHLSFTSLLMIFCYARIINKKGEINA